MLFRSSKDEHKDKIVKTSNIRISIGLNEEKMPARINWQAEDNPTHQGVQECKAMLLSLFDADHQETLKIDLWTTEMQVNEMDRFVYQSLRGIAETYFRATNNKDLASDMQQFVRYFGEQTEILPKEK